MHERSFPAFKNESYRNPSASLSGHYEPIFADGRSGQGSKVWGAVNVKSKDKVSWSISYSSQNEQKGGPT